MFFHDSLSQCFQPSCSTFRDFALTHLRIRTWWRGSPTRRSPPRPACKGPGRRKLTKKGQDLDIFRGSEGDNISLTINGQKSKDRVNLGEPSNWQMKRKGRKKRQEAIIFWFRLPWKSKRYLFKILLFAPMPREYWSLSDWTGLRESAIKSCFFPCEEDPATFFRKLYDFYYPIVAPLCVVKTKATSYPCR